MIVLSAPQWLWGLALIPLIRLLHRRRGTSRALVVPALFLWRDLAPTPTAGAIQGPPDPIWWLRALLAGLLVVALAGPGWQAPASQSLDLWIVPRPSLFAVEADGRARLAHAIDAVLIALAERGLPQIRLRDLDDPRRGEAIAFADRDALQSALMRMMSQDKPAASLPPPEPQVSHWLLADRLDTSPTRPPRSFERVLAVGQTTENVGLVRLAMRRSLADLDRIQTLVRVYNAGYQPARRELQVWLGTEALATWRVMVEPGNSVNRMLTFAGEPTGLLKATLSPPDALAEDDHLELDLARIRPQIVHLDNECAEPVQMAVAAHPGLRSGARPGARIIIDCGSKPPIDERPTLWMPMGSTSGPAVMGSWTPVALRSHPPRLTAPLQPVVLPSAHVPTTPLLDTELGPLIIERVNPGTEDHWIGVGIRFDETDSAGGSEPILLLDWLLARLAGRPLIGEPLVADRATADLVIAPGALPAPSAAPISSAVTRDLTVWLLCLACILIMVDAWLHHRRRG